MACSGDVRHRGFLRKTEWQREHKGILSLEHRGAATARERRRIARTTLGPARRFPAGAIRRGGRGEEPARPEQRATMRFMIIVKGNQDTEAAKMPPQEIFDAMAEYHEELAKAGVLLDGSGLQP